jgi:hypothetical protein
MNVAGNILRPRRTTCVFHRALSVGEFQLRGSGGSAQHSGHPGGAEGIMPKHDHIRTLALELSYACTSMDDDEWLRLWQALQRADPKLGNERVSFIEGEGPRLDALNDPVALRTLRSAVDHTALEPVYETIARVRQDLPPVVAFLGFCGAPWTLATYMIAGQGTLMAAWRAHKPCFANWINGNPYADFDHRTCECRGACDEVPGAAA